MPFNFTTSVYTPPAGATNAFPGQIIASATWNAIHSDLSTALTQLGTYLWEPKTVTGNYSVAVTDNMVMVVGAAPQITLPPSASKAGPVAILGASAGVFASNPSTVFLAAGDTFNGSNANPCMTLSANFQAQIFYPLPSGGYINAVGNVLSFNGRTGAVALQTSDIVALGGNYFIRQSKINSYTVAPGDQGTNLALSGGIFYQVTFGAASGFPANFSVTLTNEESMPGGRAKFINGVITDTNYGGFFLWPGQSVVVYNSGNQWMVLGRRRWRIPTGTTIFYVNPASGSDSYGATDGLATGTQAFASLVGVFGFIFSREIDFTDLDNNALMASISGNITGNTNLSLGAGVSNMYGPCILIEGGGTAIISGGLNVAYGWAVRIQNLTISNVGMTAQENGRIEIGPGVTFGALAAGQQHMFVYQYGAIRALSGYTINGGGASHYVINVLGSIDLSGVTVTVSGSPAFSSAVLSNIAGGFIGPTWAGGTPTGTKFSLNYNSTSFGASLVPGTIAGTANNGAVFT